MSLTPSCSWTIKHELHCNRTTKSKRSVIRHRKTIMSRVSARFPAAYQSKLKKIEMFAFYQRVRSYSDARTRSGKEAKTQVAAASSWLFVSRSERFWKLVDRCRSIEARKNQNKMNTGSVGILMIFKRSTPLYWPIDPADNSTGRQRLRSTIRPGVSYVKISSAVADLFEAITRKAG